jgi:hypothetical protein
MPKALRQTIDIAAPAGRVCDARGSGHSCQSVVNVCLRSAAGQGTYGLFVDKPHVALTQGLALTAVIRTSLFPLALT